MDALIDALIDAFWYCLGFAVFLVKFGAIICAVLLAYNGVMRIIDMVEEHIKITNRKYFNVETHKRGFARVEWTESISNTRWYTFLGEKCIGQHSSSEVAFESARVINAAILSYKGPRP